MWGEGKFLKKLKSMSTHNLGMYARANRVTDGSVLRQVDAELNQREHDAEWAEAQLMLGGW